MEENFEALLEMYMNEEEINEKIKSDNKEIKEEEKNNEKVSESKKDIRKYSEHDKMLLLLKLDNIYGKTKDKNEE